MITIFRLELKQNQWVPDVNLYRYLIQGCPQAVPLLEYAMGCCLQAWGIHNLELAQLTIANPTRADSETSIITEDKV